MNNLQLGDKYPFDGSDDFWNLGEDATPPRDWAHRAARGIIADLTDRRGIKHGFDGIDENIRIEIVAALTEIIRQAYAERATDDANSVRHYANPSVSD